MTDECTCGWFTRAAGTHNEACPKNSNPQPEPLPEDEASTINSLFNNN